MAKPAYTRLQVNERRSQLLQAGATLFTDHAYEDITMAQIAKAAGVSKPLLYHYFPSKINLFKAAVAEHADELRQLLEAPSGDTPAEQLTHALDAYLKWIEQHERTWTKLIQSTTTLPEARQLVDEFRSRTLVELAHGLTGDSLPKPALRTALHGWLGYIDAAILDWSAHHDLTRAQLRDLLLAAFGAAVLAAQQSDPSITIEPPAQPESPKQEALEHASKIFAMESYTFAQAEQLTGTTTWRTPPTSISRAGRPSDTRSTCTEMVMRPRYKRCPSASARASALGCAALMLASCGGGTAGQPARSTATRATPQQEIRVTLAQVQGAFTHLDFKRACSLLVPVSEPPDPRHVFVKPQDLPKWEAVCIKRLSANARRGASAGSFGTAKVQSIAVHGTTAEVSLQGDAGAPIVFVKIAGRWRLGLVGGY